MTKEEELRHLKDLIASKGWGILLAKMQQSITDAAFQFADFRPMNSQEVDFRRGAMWAAKQLMILPQVVTTQLENDIILSQDPASAESNASKRALRPPQPKEKD